MPNCHKLVIDATTISECLHIFCKNCIFEKLITEEVDHCPVCNIDLGCNPFEKLRPDRNLQHIREKIFPFEKEKEDVGTPIAEADQVIGPNAEVPTSSMVTGARREPGTSAQAQPNQFWFYLITADDQEGNSSLNQLPARYLRLADGNLPVSSIQKYLARKLDIANESEVEIMCQGQTLSPAMTLQNVADLWFQTLSPDIIETPVGSSGKELNMVLVYSHKVPAS